MMKIIHLTAILLCVLTVGCASQQRTFAQFAAYLDHTDPALPDASGFADKLYQLCNRNDVSVPFLKEKLASTRPRDQIAAYTALGLLVDLIQANPTPGGLEHLALIEPESMHKRFAEYDTTSLSANLKAWLTRTNELITKNLDRDGSPPLGGSPPHH
jgi:hypothetical protein